MEILSDEKKCTSLHIFMQCYLFCGGPLFEPSSSWSYYITICCYRHCCTWKLKKRRTGTKMFIFFSSIIWHFLLRILYLFTICSWMHLVTTISASSKIISVASIVSWLVNFSSSEWTYNIHNDSILVNFGMQYIDRWDRLPMRSFFLL